MINILQRVGVALALQWMVALLTMNACVAQTKDQSVEKGLSGVADFLQQHLRDPGDELARQTRYVSAAKDLDDDGIDEVIAYVYGPGWCGTGGCHLFVLKRENSSYRVVARLPGTHAPIRVLERMSNGWHSLAVWVRGGGIIHGYEAELPFDGETYPTNSSMPPSRRLEGKAPGEVVIAPSQEGQLLYP